jgi:hypothetical protein
MTLFRIALVALALLGVQAIATPSVKAAPTQYKDIACETTTTTGTGTINLGGAMTGGYKTFAAAGVMTGSLVPYRIWNSTDIETGWGTFTDATPDTLTRVLSSSTTGSLISLTGTNNVCVSNNAEAVKTILNADTTFNVRTDGSDTVCNGLASASAASAPHCSFATPNGAYEHVLQHYDANGKFIKFRMGNGTYTSSTHRRTTDEFSADTTVLTINKNIQNAASVEFEGDISVDDDDYSDNPVIWDCDGGNCIFLASSAGIFRFQGIAFVDSAVDKGDMVFAFNSAMISFNSVDFGAAGNYQIHVGPLTTVKIFGDYSISGGADFAHMFIEQGSAVDHEVSLVTLTNTPDFGLAFIWGVSSDYALISVTYAGAATGQKYRFEGGNIGTSSGNLDTLLPGDVSGTVSDGYNSEVSITGRDTSLLISTLADGPAEDQFLSGGSDTSPLVQMFGSVGIMEYGNAVGGGKLFCGHSRSGTRGTYTIVQDNDELCRIGMFGADGSELGYGAAIIARVDGTPGSASMPTELVVGTSDVFQGNTTNQERWRWSPPGHFEPMVNASFDIGVADTFGVRDLFLDGTQLALDDNTALRFYETEANGDNYLGFVAPTAVTTNQTCTLENDASFIPDSCVGDGTDDGGGGLGDGDYGDITVSGTGTVLTCDAATETDQACVELATTAEAITGTDTTRAVTAAGVKAAGTGRRMIWIPAAALMGRVTTGADCSTMYDSGASDVTIRACSYADGTNFNAQFQLGMPISWDEGTVTFQPVWTVAAGTGTVEFELSCVAISNDDPLNATMGTGQASNDTILVALDQHTGPESAAITCGGTPAAGDFVAFNLMRDTGADTAAQTAILFGIYLFITTTAETEE